ncbi:MAG TPA: hypothetical protein DCO79_01940 [Spirochaeta sp.]|nr:hypothetical protein [Spirochaeta sp.]
MVIDFNNVLTNCNTIVPVTTLFLDRYTCLLTNLKTAFKGRRLQICKNSIVSNHVAEMKEFVIEFGGLQTANLLAEYEMSSSIGDACACKNMEDRILNELNVFKECWLSMLC